VSVSVIPKPSCRGVTQQIIQVGIIRLGIQLLPVGAQFWMPGLMVLATTMMTPPLLRLAYPRRRGRPHVAVEEAFTAVPDTVHDAVGTSKR